MANDSAEESEPASEREIVNGLGADGDRAARTLPRLPRALALWIVVAGVAPFVLGRALWNLSRDAREISGVPCDVPDGASFCQKVPDANWSDSGAFETGLGNSERPFVRINAPSTEISIWLNLAVFAIMSSVVLAAATVRWRGRLHSFSPSGGRFGVKQFRNVALAAVLATGGFAWAFYATKYLGRDVEAVVTVALWGSAAFAITSAADCWTIAEHGARAGSALPERAQHLRELGRLHDRFIAVLGAQVTIYVIWLSADARMKDAIDESKLARIGGEFLNGQRYFREVIFSGLLFTWLLALAYFPAAGTIRKQADELLEETFGDLAQGDDFSEFSKQRTALASRLGVEQPLRAQFQSAVIIAAPLLTSLLASSTSGI